MNDLVRDTLEYLKSHKDPIYADPSDCQYFRDLYKKPLPPVPVPMPVPEKKVVPVPVPLPEEKALPPPEPPREEEGKGKGKGIGMGKGTGFLTDWAATLNLTPLPPPSDAIAKKIATRWKTKNQVAPVTIISFQETPEILKEIAKAVDVYFGPAKIVAAEPIEKEMQWEVLFNSPDLKAVVICDYFLWQLPGLLKYYKENTHTRTRQLGEKPLFLLPDLSLYLKDPQLKRSLWKALCAFLQPYSSTKV